MIESEDIFMRDDDELFEDGFLNGHDVWRDHEDGGIWFDGYFCSEAKNCFRIRSCKKV